VCKGFSPGVLDLALLNNQIDIAVHSMKDVPTQLAKGIAQASVLERASHKDIFCIQERISCLRIGTWAKARNPSHLDMPGLVANQQHPAEGTVAEPLSQSHH
jgi:hydroxymethylbilane synthase